MRIPYGAFGYLTKRPLKQVTEQDFSQLSMPDTDPMFILADPDRAFELSNYPNKGWFDGMELRFQIALRFIHWHCEPEKVTDKAVTDQISELTKGYKDSTKYFIDKLAEAVSIVAAALSQRCYRENERL
jgi:pyruvate,water dikinase